MIYFVNDIYCKLHAKPYFYPEPPPLNELRLQDKCVFSTKGIDNLGTLFVKNGYGNANKEMCKAWVNCNLDLIPILSVNLLKTV